MNDGYYFGNLSTRCSVTRVLSAKILVNSPAVVPPRTSGAPQRRVRAARRPPQTKAMPNSGCSTPGRPRCPANTTTTITATPPPPHPDAKFMPRRVRRQTYVRVTKSVPSFRLTDGEKAESRSGSRPQPGSCKPGRERLHHSCSSR